MVNSRIAIIGSGIAGLSSSYFLTHNESSDSIKVSLFESADQLGMDSKSCEIKHKIKNKQGEYEEKIIRIDTPLRVFTESYYPHLSALYSSSGIIVDSEDYSGSFSSFDNSTYFLYNNLSIAGYSIPLPAMSNSAIFSLKYWRILKDWIYLIAKAKYDFHYGILKQYKENHNEINQKEKNNNKSNSDNPKELTFLNYLKICNFSFEFIYEMIIPTMSGICTCNHTSIANYPAHIVLNYLIRRNLGGVKRVRCGTSQVVKTLSEGAIIHTNTKIQSIISKNNIVIITTDKGEKHEFDSVIIATQANQAKEMLNHSENLKSNANFKELLFELGNITYENSSVAVHRDPLLMPEYRNSWRSVNFILDETNSSSMASIWLNRCQTNVEIDESDSIFQTWNPLIKPDSTKLIHMAEFQRPVVTFRSLEAIERIQQLNGINNIWICGSYADKGIPLLESATTSAKNVVTKMGYNVKLNTQNKKTNYSKINFMGLSPLALIFIACILALLLCSS